MRFSIKTLLMLTTAVAVTLVCMMYPAPLLASAYYFAAVTAILLAIVAAIQLRGSRRAFAVSFAIVAGSYLWLAMPTPVEQIIQAQYGGGSFSRADQPLLTTMLLHCCYEAYVPHESGGRGASTWLSYSPNLAGRAGRSGNGVLESVLTPNRLSFLTIGHSMFAVWFGWLAGILGRRLHTKGNDLFQSPRPSA